MRSKRKYEAAGDAPPSFDALERFIGRAEGVVAKARPAIAAAAKTVDETAKAVYEAMRKVASLRSQYEVLSVMVDGQRTVMGAVRKFRNEQTPDKYAMAVVKTICTPSVRQWARRCLSLVKDGAAEADRLDGRIAKLSVRAKDGGNEGGNAETLLIALKRRRDAQRNRIALAVRKFLEVRQCVMMTLLGTTEQILKAAQGRVSALDLEAYAIGDVASQIDAAAAKAARNAVKTNRRRK